MTVDRSQEAGPAPARPNVLLLLFDSFRRDQLVPYGGPRERAPNLNGFGARALTFRNHFVGSLPTIPARREIWSGRREFLWRPWGPLEPFDDRLPRRLAQGGYRTAIVTDNYHYWEEAANGYLQSFQSAELVRGHELDFWKQAVPGEAVPRWVENIERWRPGQGRRYYANVRDFAGEEDYFPARVMSAASDWLERNGAGGPFFLQVETFDAHEPFDVPEPYASMYGDPRDRDRFTVWPPYQDPRALAAFWEATSPAELEFIRSQYQGKVAMIDRWVGRLFETMERCGLWETTTVIVTSDHGHDLGERKRFGKEYPHYDSHANIPLMIWHPEIGRRGEDVDALTTTADLHATILDLAGMESRPDLPSRSLLPLMAGSASSIREGIIYGTFGQGICCTDGEWTLFKSPEADTGLFYYSTAIYRPPLPGAGPIESGYFIPGVEYPQWRVPVRARPCTVESSLFNRLEDPDLNCSRWDTDPRARRSITDLARELMGEEGYPQDQAVRLGLDPA